jgi:NAD(P)-dependent dehydrogenase (short-subunit alcohol dehydrogenase family)
VNKAVVVSFNFPRLVDKQLILISAIHLTKWAMEGFCDTLAREVAPLNIEVTIVEPGAHHTAFGTGLASAPVMESYSRSKMT